MFVLNERKYVIGVGFFIIVVVFLVVWSNNFFINFKFELYVILILIIKWVIELVNV